MKHGICIAFIAAGLMLDGTAWAGVGFDAGAILTQSKAQYAALHSYSDTGSVTAVSKSPGAPADVEKFTFVTAYVAPRKFLFDSKKLSNGERVVVWANSGDFNSWWSATKVHQDYPQGQGDMAFANASYPTNGAVMQIASLLFASAGLQSSLASFSDPKAGTVENVDGKPCYKITGQIAIAYGSGTVAGAHKATLWIDKSTLLVRKLFEDTPGDAGTGFVSTVTTTFNPQANPKLDSARFAVVVPTN